MEPGGEGENGAVVLMIMTQIASAHPSAQPNPDTHILTHTPMHAYTHRIRGSCFLVHGTVM